MNLNHELPKAAVFDMDGVLVNSNPFHVEKWAEFLTRHGVTFDRDELPKQVLGIRNDEVLRLYFGHDLSAADLRRLDEELEASFRSAFRPHARPLPGLEALVAELNAAQIPMAVASCAMSRNVEFIVDALGLRPHFRYLVSGDEVTHPKPHPEIYFKVAQMFGVPPSWCVVFEDSFAGIEAAKRAGMKCVAIASTFPLDELRTETQADLVVKSFEELDLKSVRALFSAEGTPV
ncbi:MAG TPA: HAD family phosphatase [Terriglobia bacterium]|nr:HAD family phosphatase [Terriglobia bacterium]